MFKRSLALSGRGLPCRDRRGGAGFAQRTKSPCIRRSRTTSSARSSRRSRPRSPRPTWCGCATPPAHHGAVPRRERQSARRHGVRPRGHQPDAVREGRPARDLRAEGRRRTEAGLPRRRSALHLDRHGRLSLGAVLQHRRGQEEQRRDTDLVADSPSPTTWAR